MREVSRRLEALAPKSSAAVRDLADKSKELQAKAAKVFTDKAELLRKGTAYLDISKKLQPVAEAVAEARGRWRAAVENTCDP